MRYPMFVLKQIHPRSWEIQLEDGHTVSGDLFYGNQHKAEEWCRAFVSSWACAHFRVEVLDDTIRGEQPVKSKQKS